MGLVEKSAQCIKTNPSLLPTIHQIVTMNMRSKTRSSIMPILLVFFQKRNDAIPHARMATTLVVYIFTGPNDRRIGNILVLYLKIQRSKLKDFNI